MQRLLYHAPDNPNQESPFDRAIVQVVHGQEVSIVSPYIGAKYLHRMIGMSHSWRLVSDVLEWLSGTPVQERDTVYAFLKEHDGLVHHYPAIHAKTVVSSAGAYTGSANLTDAGVLRRTEFGVLITDPVQVQEIQQWFDAIWAQTSPPPLQSVLELIDELNRISRIATQFGDLRATQLESGARRVRAKLVKILGHEPLSASARLQRNEVMPSRAVAAAQSPRVVLQAFSAPALRQLQALSFDLEAEIDAYVSRNAVGTFTFAEVHMAMRRLSPSVTMRKTYLAIIESCASHPRVLFSEEAVNRLVYRDGRFVQSRKDQLIEALKPMDDLVSWIIDSLPFGTPVSGLEYPAELASSISAIRTVLDGMVNAGFVRRHDGLSLIPTAIWSQRLKLLERSHRKWNAQLTKYQFGLARERTAVVQPVVGAQPENASPKAEVAHERSAVENEEIETYEASALRRQEKFDHVFSHLAWLHGYKGEVIESNVEALTNNLMDLSQLSFDEVTRLISGTYSFLRSPFIVLQTGTRKQCTIIPDLLDNAHLKDLPMTSAVIANSKSLKQLTQPPQALSQERTSKSVEISRTGQSFKSITIEQADQAYQSICKRIFEHIDSPMTPMDRDALLWTLSRSGVNQDLVRRLILGSWGTQFSLFEVQHHKRGALSINLMHKNLEMFPRTYSYLKEVVWPSGRRHYSLLSVETFQERAIKEFEKATLRGLTKKASSRDRAYAALLAFIVKRIPQNTRYTRPDALVGALTGAKVNPFVVAFLIGIQQTPSKQLLIVQRDKIGFFLELDHKVLSTYTRCQRYLATLADSNKPIHSWLLKSAHATETPAIAPVVEKSQTPSTVAASVQSTTARTESNKQNELSPLVWDDHKHLELDNLYSDLAKLYIDHGKPVMLSSETAQEMQDTVLAKYLQICEFRKANTRKHHPVLSLRIFEEPKNLELVIYSSFREQILRFPKLQRLLSRSPLRLREE